jgi:hypothetical protein
MHGLKFPFVLIGAIYMATGLAGVARQPAVSLRTGVYSGVPRNMYLYIFCDYEVFKVVVMVAPYKFCFIVTLKTDTIRCV